MDRQFERSSAPGSRLNLAHLAQMTRIATAKRRKMAGQVLSAR
jgi:hypothetical protein